MARPLRRRLGPRFGAEAGLIAAAAALAALLELDWPGIVAAVFGTWLAIAVFEVVWSRTRPVPAETTEVAASPQAVTVVTPPPPPTVAVSVPEPEPEVAAPPPPAVTPVPLVAAPPPPPTPTPAPVASPPPPPVERPRTEKEPDIQTGPSVVAGAPRSWNLWELERAARELAGGDPAVDEERQYMLLYLRDFASADGKLPIEFDPLVREVFGEELVIAS